MSKKKIILITLGILALIVFLFPVTQSCGSPWYSCATPDFENPGKVCYSYDKQPLGITVIEFIFWTDTNIEYYEYSDCI